jgi:circadian clock protein KaiB
VNGDARYSFRLYVAGDAPNCALARRNLSALCDAHLAGRHEIEIVDIYQQPGRALADKVFMTPTLLKLAPAPPQTLVGSLSQTGAVLLALGLAGVTP